MKRYAEFESFQLDTQARVLRRVAPVRMEPAALRLLEILLRSEGRAVHRDILLKELCGTELADDANVRVAVKKLRFALGDDDAKRDFKLVVNADGGYRLAPEVRWHDEPPARRRRRWGLAGAAVLFLAALGCAAYASFLAPFVTVSAPTEIEVHEAQIFGQYRGEEDAEVVVYVHPDDRGNTYWPQARVRRNVRLRSWQVTTRFGNEFGIDMRQPPPLGFDVVAALVPARRRGHFPIEGEGGSLEAADLLAFRRELLRRGALAVSEPRRVQRNPEPACVQQMVTLLSPSNAVGGGPAVTPPVAVAWDPPDAMMYAAVWREGVGVPVFRATERIPSGMVLADLEPGTYQIKVAPMMAGAELWCSSSAWFVVAAR